MQIKAEYACLQAYLTQFIWRSNHMSKKQAVKQRFCVLNSYNILICIGFLQKSNYLRDLADWEG